VLCCQCFVKWRTTACSLSWALWSLGTYFTPQLANYVLNEYGAPEMFLFIGALTMNVLPCAFVLKRPPWMNRKKLSKAGGDCEKLSEGSLGTESTTKFNDGINLKNYKLLNVEETIIEEQEIRDCLDIVPSSREGNIIDPSEQDFYPKDTQMIAAPTSSSVFFKGALRVFLSPIFHIDAMGWTLIDYTNSAFVLVHIDMARDRGIDESKAVYFLHAYSSTSFLMRLLGAHIVDRGYLTLQSAFLLSFLGVSIACLFMAFCRKLVFLLLCSLLLGLSQGFVIAVPSPMLVKDFPDQPIPIMLGGVLFIDGLTMMTLPSLV
ncbi:hypothetical protein HPB47_028395, partial [Ixodes persulcatus]